MISTGDLRKGVVIELDGDLWQILDYHHIKMGRGFSPGRTASSCATSRRDTVEKSFQPASAGRARRSTGRPVPVSRTATTTTSTSWRPSPTSSSACGPRRSRRRRLPRRKDDPRPDELPGDTLGIELPVTVDLLVAETEFPGFAGDNAQGARKNVPRWRRVRRRRAAVRQRGRHPPHRHPDRRVPDPVVSPWAAAGSKR